MVAVNTAQSEAVLSETAKLTKHVRKLIQKMTCADPKQRISAVEVNKDLDFLRKVSTTF